jgi:hypothetical protein
MQVINKIDPANMFLQPINQSWVGRVSRIKPAGKNLQRSLFVGAALPSQLKLSLTHSCSISAIDMQASCCVRRIDFGSATPSFLIPTTPLAASYRAERF